MESPKDASVNGFDQTQITEESSGYHVVQPDTKPAQHCCLPTMCVATLWNTLMLCCVANGTNQHSYYMSGLQVFLRFLVAPRTCKQRKLS